jgi:hypothetical protein
MWRKENMERKKSVCVCVYIYIPYPKVNSSLNNPKNIEIKFCENMKFDMLKIIIGLHFE